MIDPHLTTAELHALWLTVPEDRKLAFMTSLEACCWERLATYQTDLHARALDLTEDRPRQRSRGSISPTISLASLPGAD